MLVYWALFSYFAVGALVEQPHQTRSLDPAFWLGGLFIVLVIGLRFQVGADWQPYVEIFNYSGRISLEHAARLNDPGYFILNWLVHQVGSDFWLVNTICGSIFCFGLMRLVRTQERPWLTTLVAIPYLIVVVAMGYTRQSVALGFMMAGLAGYFKNRSILKLGAYFFLASLFHRTALLAFPFVCLGTSRNVFISALLASVLTYFMYSMFLSQSMELLLRNYVDRVYSSQGAAIRVTMNVVPALLFFLNRSRLEFTPVQGAVWRNLSVASFMLLVSLWLVRSSTVVDRLALYVIPLQLAVLPRAYKGRISDLLGVTAIILYSALVQFAWLEFAVHARFWVPYSFWPFE